MTKVLVFITVLLLAVSVSTATASNPDEGGGAPECTHQIVGMEIWAIYPGDPRFEAQYVCQCPSWYWCTWAATGFIKWRSYAPLKLVFRQN